MWVLVRSEDGKYVSKPGSERSYTTKLENAQTFPTEAAAKANACGNELAVRRT